MKKTILILLGILLLSLIGLFIFQSGRAKGDNEYSTFMSNWTKAGEFKYEEITKKKQASLLIAEAEQARIEKERLLGTTTQPSTGSINSGEDGKLQ